MSDGNWQLKVHKTEPCLEVVSFIVNEYFIIKTMLTLSYYNIYMY